MNDYDEPTTENECSAGHYEEYMASQFPDTPTGDDSFLQSLMGFDNAAHNTAAPKDEAGLWMIARSKGMTAAQLIIKDGLAESMSDRKWWAQPADQQEKSSFVAGLNLIGSTESVLSAMAKGLACQIQFPVNTAYLHGLGVIASLAVRRFKVAYWNDADTIPVNLYVVTSQPPSSGKSGINNGYTKHARILIAEENAKNRKFYAALDSKIKKLAVAIEKHKGSQHECDQMLTELWDMQEKLSLVAPYKYGLGDSTPEAAEAVCAKQGGVFTIVSAESVGVKSILGDLYGKGTPNQNLFLSAWDGEYISSARITRDPFEGFVCGSIAVLAQDSTFDSILATAGSDSCGVSERFLMGREPDMAGHRKSKDRKQMPIEARIGYEKLVGNILSQPATTLTLEREALSQMCIIKDYFDDQSAPNCRYSNDIMKGIVGKADKQIHKIASVLHIVEHWVEGGQKTTTIKRDTVFAAFHIFKECVKIYEAIADNRGVTGKNTSLNSAIAKIKKMTSDPRNPKLKLTLAKLRDDLKGLKELKRENFTEYLRGQLIADLEKMNIIAFDERNDIIYINPLLRD